MHPSSTLKSAITKPTFTLSILESHLSKCYSKPKLFPQVHAQSIISGIINDTYAASRLISLCTISLSFPVNYSLLMLQQVKSPNSFIFNSILKAFVKRSLPHCCLRVYKNVIREGFLVDNYTYPVLLQACGIRKCEVEGNGVHNHVMKLGFRSDVYVVNTLIYMYSACGNLIDARLVFDESPVLDNVSWNSILAAYVQVGDVNESIRVFEVMPYKDVMACNSMISVFGKRNRLEDARMVFDEMFQRDVISWSAMISSYVNNGLLIEALEMFSKMDFKEKLADEGLMVIVLSACAQTEVTMQGENIHAFIIKIGLESYIIIRNSLIHLYGCYSDIESARRIFYLSKNSDVISWNSLLSCYMKCGLIKDAQKLFDEMPKKDLVSWSTIISGYAQNNQFKEALNLLNRMLIKGIKPDETILVSAISACTNMSALEEGKWVHKYIQNNEYNLDTHTFIGTALIDMYMKCGCSQEALQVFYSIKEKGVSIWNAVILGLAMNNLVKECLNKFSKMENFGVKPNEITFVGILGACRHVGLVEQGRFYFNLMQEKYKIQPNIRHYGCMVDLIGRAGYIKEAESLIENMPFRPDVTTWGALFGACKKYGETEIGVEVGRKLVEMKPNHDGFNVMLGNLYASKDMWDNLEDLRGSMKERNVNKVPGCSLNV